MFFLLGVFPFTIIAEFGELNLGVFFVFFNSNFKHIHLSLSVIAKVIANLEKINSGRGLKQKFANSVNENSTDTVFG